MEQEKLRCRWSGGLITPENYSEIISTLFIFRKHIDAILMHPVHIAQHDSALLLYTYCYYTHCISYSYRYCFLTFALDVSVNIRRRDFPFPARTTNLYRRIDDANCIFEKFAMAATFAISIVHVLALPSILRFSPSISVSNFSLLKFLYLLKLF